MKLRTLGGTNAYSSSNGLVYVNLQTAELIDNPVSLGKK